MTINKIKKADEDLERILSNFGDDTKYHHFIKELRPLIEYIMYQYWEIEHGACIDINNDNKRIVLNAGKQSKNKHYREAVHFHDRTNTGSHDAPDNEGCKALYDKYYDYLEKLRNYVKKDFKIDILQYLERNLPQSTNPLDDYYRKVAEILLSHNYLENEGTINGKFYVMKTHRYFYNRKKIYELTLSPVLADNKFDKFIVFSLSKLDESHAHVVDLCETTIKLNGIEDIPIKIVKSAGCGIRACEFKNLALLVGSDPKSPRGTFEYTQFNNLLTQNNWNLEDVIYLSEDQFKNLYYLGGEGARASHRIYEMLKIVREVILEEKTGANLLKLLINYVRNAVIKSQLNKGREPNPRFGNMPIINKSLPFDNMPFANNVTGHNIPFSAVINAISPFGKDDELLANKIETNVNERGILYTPISELNVDEPEARKLIQSFNSRLYSKHRPLREIKISDSYAYMTGYDESSYKIMISLMKLSGIATKGYSNHINRLIDEKSLQVDCEEKKGILIKAFESSRLAITNGPAGTGKSFVIGLVCKALSQFNPLLLARTNAAVGNLRNRRCVVQGRTMTIEKYLHEIKKGNKDKLSTRLLVIDECSTVSNKDMLGILESIDLDSTLVLLAGDDHQIGSIDFGNWFKLALDVLPKGVIHTLKNNYRASISNGSGKSTLLKLWETSRKTNGENRALEIITSNYFKPLEEFDFASAQDEDEIVLCLNYDGLFGINNINRLMQRKNTNRSVTVGPWRYSIGDPIIFDYSQNFSDYVFSETKGKILDLEETESRYRFKLAINREYDPIWAIEKPDCFDSVEPYGERSCAITISISKGADYEEDEEYQKNYLVPFRVAYAMSIHKAQGLEYASVKIIISDAVEPLITPNIFYTAITRTTAKLQIYSTAKALKQICERMENEFGDKHDYKEFMHLHQDLEEKRRNICERIPK